MANFQFLGSGDPIEAFNIDGTLLNKALQPGEMRLRKAFPYPALEMWRRSTLQFTASPTPTGTSAIGTQGRTVVLYAHEADFAPVFYELVGTSADALAGYYVDKRKAIEADRLLSTALQAKEPALAELAMQGIPKQHCDLIRSRLESPSFNHRVPGMCAAVYLTSIILEQAEGSS
jgi:hypothetical protein